MKELITSISPKHLLVTALALGLIAYAGFQARFVIFGPQISITSHDDGDVLAGHIIELEGYAKNVSWLDLNDRQIFTDEHGFWQETLVVSPGMSIMTLKAKNKFGREKESSIRLILN